jgi:hypothetical protein
VGKDMKKYDLILKISFIPYILVMYARPYVTAQTWANHVFYLFLGAIFYQLCYLVFLRKKENVSFLKSLARTFLYLSFSAGIYVLTFYLDIYFNGYSYCFFMAYYGPYYGFEAWKHAGFASLLLIPLLCVSTIYEICYFIISKRIKKSSISI